jgi:hypothetical protein
MRRAGSGCRTGRRVPSLRRRARRASQPSPSSGTPTCGASAHGRWPRRGAAYRAAGRARSAVTAASNTPVRKRHRALTGPMRKLLPFACSRGRRDVSDHNSRCQAHVMRLRPTITMTGTRPNGGLRRSSARPELALRCMQVAGSSTSGVQRPQSARCWPPDGPGDQGRGTHRDLEYVEAFYNRRRRHSTLGMLAPLEYENRTRMTGGTSLAASRLASTNKIGLQDNVNGQRRLIDAARAHDRSAALNHRRPSRNRPLYWMDDTVFATASNQTRASRRVASQRCCK